MSTHPELTVSDNQPDLTLIQKQIRTSFDKRDLARWTTLKVGRVYRDLILAWVGIGIAMSAVSQMQTGWIYALAFLTIGCCQYALFILGHDAIHGSLHPHRTINDRLSNWLIHGPMFMGMEDGRRSHLEHHRTLGTTADPDRYLHTFSHKASRFKFLLFCSGLATFGKTVLKVTPFGRLLAQTSEAKSVNSPKSLASLMSVLGIYLKQRLAVLVTQPLLISALWVMGLPWWAYPLLWIAPIYFCVFLPDEVRAFCDHAVLLTPDEKADARRLVTFQPDWFEAMIFSPHNMNYHAEHHLLPTVPYYNLPAVHKVIGHRPEITVRRSYIAFLFRVINFLPQ
ncbi:MAG: fatty acid desaturase [Cyanobacteria bacterium J06635_15]